MNRGDIIYVNLPPVQTHEQSGARPAIVIQNNAVTVAVPTVLIVPLTTRMSALRFPHTFIIAPSSGNGLAASSVALVFQLRAVDKTRVGRRVGALDVADLQKLENNLSQLLH